MSSRDLDNVSTEDLRAELARRQSDEESPGFYRLLNLGEVVKEGDEYWDGSGSAWTALNSKQLAALTVENRVIDVWDDPWRRRIQL